MILVTGGSGFLGQHLVRRLSKEGGRVRALYNSRKPEGELGKLPGIEWIKADLLDIYDVETALEGISHIYHCAAIVSFQPGRKEEMIQVNTDIACNVINAALDAGIERMLYVSSIAAIGRDERSKAPISEDSEWTDSKLNSGYAISKHSAEMEVWRGMAEGLNAVIINPGIILGSGDWTDGSAQLMEVAAKEFPFYTTGINSFTGVDDVVEIMVRLMNSDITEERYIVSTGNYSYQEIFNLMADALGKKRPRIHAGPGLSGLAWRWGRMWQILTGKKPAVTKETARTAGAQCFYDNSKLLAALPGFEYSPINDTIKKMAEAYKAEH